MPSESRRTKRTVARTHEWRDAKNKLLFEHRKFSDGGWGYRHPCRTAKCPDHTTAEKPPRGGWCYYKPASAVGAMWRYGELLDAISDGLRVGWFAGEKDADAGWQAGLADAATSVHQGEAGEISPEQVAIFEGFAGRLDLYGDDDPTGRKNLAVRFDVVKAVGVPVRRIRLLLPAEGSNDVSDHLTDAESRARGFRELTIGELRAFVKADEKAAAAKKRRAVDGPDANERLKEFEERLAECGHKKGTGQDWTCPHPAHPDKHPSFGVAVGRTGGLILNCQKCMPKSGTPEHGEWIGEILDALDLDHDAIAPPSRKKHSGTKGGRGDGETVLEKLLKIAFDNYTLGINDEGRPFAHLNGGHVVSFFDKGNGQFSNNLQRDYNRTHNKGAGNGAISDAIGTLTGYANECEPQEVALRVCAVGGGEDITKRIIIDMGDAAETVISAGVEGWELTGRSPVLFKRSKATMSYPKPLTGMGVQGIDRFHDLLNLSDVDFDLAVAWMVSTFIPDIQIPAMMLNGEHGTGKSDATRMITMLLDPNVAPLRKRPRDEREWSVAASASRVISLENMSWIDGWLSDDLCTAITGAGDIERQYHTNDDIRIRKIKRVILINGIDPGGVRGDLADRMFTLSLQRIESRVSEQELEAKFAGMAPELFGSLLDLLVEVQKVRLSGANWIETNERMHDFALVVRAVDLVRQSSSYERYIELKAEGQSEVTEDDPLTAIIQRALRGQPGGLTGTASALYETFDLDGRQSGIPKTARALSQAFTRLAPGWKEIGIFVDKRRSNGSKIFNLWLEKSENDNGE